MTVDFGYLNLFREITAPDPTDELRYGRVNRGFSVTKTNEGRMWAAALQLGITDVLAPIRKRYHYEALEWIKDDSDAVGSFKFVCETLGIDPQAAQRRLLDTLAQRGGSDAVIPKVEPKGPQSSHRGRIPRKVIACQQLQTNKPSTTDLTAAPTAPDAEHGDESTLPIAVCR